MPWTRHPDLIIRPQNVQISPEQTTPSFPWNPRCIFRISASGMIGSGVVCTGLTPPGGWGGAEWLVRPDETDWPCRGGGARRYGLIGSIDGGSNWFYVGRGTTHLTTEPGMPISLNLAVNRPNLRSTAAGDHEWTVVVETYEFRGGDPPNCDLIRESILRRRTEAQEACDRTGAGNRALSARLEEMWITFQVAGGLALALIFVALPVLVAQEAAQNATLNAAITSLRGALSSALGAIRPGGIPVGSILSAAVAGLASTQTARSAATAATANASPVGLNPFVRAVIIGLTILMLGAFGIAIGLALSLLTLGAERDNALSDWNATLERVRREIELTSAVCGTMTDEPLPTCMAVEG